MTATPDTSVRRPRARRPVVAGVAGGVGATTVATVLGAVDAGVFTGRPVDVLACRATGDSLVRAARAAQLIVAGGHRAPVVAVTAAAGTAAFRPVTARLQLLAPHTSGLVVLPFVRRWSTIASPLSEAASLARRSGEMPRPLRRYAAAVRSLQSALGRLPATAAPSVPRLSRTPGRSPQR